LHRSLNAVAETIFDVICRDAFPSLLFAVTTRDMARSKASLKETAMDVRGYALTISIVAALCSGMAVPASAMPNMPHAFAKREVARCGGDVSQASKHYRYQNSSRSYSGDPGGCYGSGPNSPWYPE
jgi:hypothetical protein